MIIWETETGNIVRQIGRDSIDAFFAVAISPDGTLVMSNGETTEAVIWEVATGEPLHILQGHTGLVSSVAFAPDGKTAASASSDNSIILWEVETGSLQHILQGHTSFINRVVFSPDGTRLASASDDATMILWNTENGTIEKRFQGHEVGQWVQDVAYNPDGSQVATTSTDERIIIWNINSFPDNILEWALSNRYVPELTCEQRLTFEIEPLCDENRAFPTSTVFPTLEPSATPTATSTPDVLTPTPTPPVYIASALEVTDLTSLDGQVSVEVANSVVELNNTANDLNWIGGTYADFIIGANVILDPDNQEDDGCGFLFRYLDPNNYYDVIINRRNQIYFNRLIDGETDDSVRGSLVNVNTDSPNELIVIGSGDIFTIYLNGQRALQIRDASLVSGRLGVYASSVLTNLPTRCEFTDIWVWEFTEEPQVPLFPTPAPTPIYSVSNQLALMGLSPESGLLKAETEFTQIDQTGLDERLSWEWLGEDGQEDYAISTTFQWGPGAKEDECGFLFNHVNGNNYYYLGVNQLGNVYITYRANGEWHDENFFLDGRDVRTGFGNSNELTLKVVDNVYSVYVNGNYAGAIADETHPRGSAALLAVTYDESDVTYCSFFNSWLWEIQSITSSAPTPTPLPTNTPQPVVRNILAEIGINPGDGYEAERIDHLVIDLSEEDNLFQPELFLGTYADFVLGTTFAWGPGATEDECGLLFRYGGLDNFFGVWATRSQTLNVQNRFESEW
jgi:hypothetical protein